MKKYLKPIFVILISTYVLSTAFIDMFKNDKLYLSSTHVFVTIILSIVFGCFFGIVSYEYRKTDSMVVSLTMILVIIIMFLAILASAFLYTQVPLYFIRLFGGSSLFVYEGWRIKKEGIVYPD